MDLNALDWELLNNSNETSLDLLQREAGNQIKTGTEKSRQKLNRIKSNQIQIEN